MNLADGLLAPLPKGIFSPREMLTTKCSIENKREVNISGNTEDTGSAFKNVILARMKLMGNHPKLLEKFGGFASGSDTGFISVNIFPLFFFFDYRFIRNLYFFFMVQVFDSSVNSTVRRKCLSVISKLMYYSTPAIIQSMQCVTNISR